MAFPTTGILDDFNRANESPLSGGGVWVAGETGGQLAVVSNAVKGTANNAINSRFYSGGPYGPDCEVYITMTVVDLTASDYIRLYIRRLDPADTSGDGYMMQWSNDANGCRIFKQVNGGFTALAQNTEARFAANDQIGVECIGSQITTYQNGVSVVTVSDTTYTGAGYLGLAFRDDTHMGDNFGGGTVVVAAAAAFTPRVMTF